MNQNLPPNAGQSGEYPTDDHGQGSNPYLAAQQSGYNAPQQPDLDAAAPQLKQVESQRMNTKALMLIVAIMAVLMLMIYLVMRNGSSDKEEAPKPREEKVVIPELPKAAGQNGPDYADTQQNVQPVPVQELPPLPPEPRDDRQAPQDVADAGPPVPQGPTLAERRMGMTSSSRGGASALPENSPFLQAALDAQQQRAGGAQGGQSAAAAQSANKISVAQYLRNPDTLLVRGTYIRCVLETRIVTDYPGFTSCIVTEPVYSINGRRLLLPKGSKALGRYEGEPTGPRVAVLWDRITTPNGLDVTLEGPGVDNLGGSGHPGDYNGHWFSKMSSALMISLVSDAFKYEAAEHGPKTSEVTSGGTIVSQPFESNTAKTMERLANQALSKAESRPATVTINQGTVLNIYVAKDVDFSSVVEAH